MSYKLALEHAGAKVIDYEAFGDYQGSWYAKVQRNSEVFYVAGNYGSCSGCDSFQAEFDYGDSHEHADGIYISSYDFPTQFDETCEGCKALHKKLAEFGEGYLSDQRTWEQLWNDQESRKDWDSEVPEVQAWLTKVKDA